MDVDETTKGKMDGMVCMLLTRSGSDDVRWRTLVLTHLPHQLDQSSDKDV